VGSLCMTEKDEKKDEERERAEMPVHVKAFDPENPPYQTLRLCVYLRELEEEKEKEEREKRVESNLHK
jgi:hypothetical protein